MFSASDMLKFLQLVDILKNEDRFFPAFKQHSLYNKMLAELGLDISDLASISAPSTVDGAADDDDFEMEIGSLTSSLDLEGMEGEDIEFDALSACTSESASKTPRWAATQQ